MTFSLLDTALLNANELLTTSKAKYRLKDILVEEVSIVDRPANQHTFLVVKRDSRNSGEVTKSAAPKKGMSREKLESLREQRSREYGIEILDSGSNLTFPAGYPVTLTVYGDPVNLKFPTDTTKRARNARVRFKQFASAYKKTASKRVIHERIVRAELKHGIKPKYDSSDALDKLLPSSLRSRMEEVAKKSEDKNMSNLFESVAKSLEKLTAFAKALQDGEDTEGLSDELKSELSSISSDIAKVYVEHGLTKASDAVIQAVESLVQISQVSLLLAEDIAVSGEISDESNTQMTKISSLLSAITKSDEEGEGETEGDTNVSADDEGAQDKSDEDTTDDGVSKDANSDADASASASKDEPEPSKVDALAEQVGQLAATVTTFINGLTEAQKATKSEEEVKKSEEEKADSLQKQIDDLKLANAALETKLRKATEEPPEKGSGKVTKSVEEPKKVLFPLDYNDPIYNPDATAS